MREISYTVPAEFDGVQAQVFLKSRGISRRVLTALKRSGGLTAAAEHSALLTRYTPGKSLHSGWTAAKPPSRRIRSFPPT